MQIRPFSWSWVLHFLLYARTWAIHWRYYTRWWYLSWLQSFIFSRCLRSSNLRETLHPSHRKPSCATHPSPCHVHIVPPSRPQAWNNLTPTWKPCLLRAVDKSGTNARFRDLSSRSQGHPQVCYWTHLFIFLFDSRFWIETGVQTSFRRVP